LTILASTKSPAKRKTSAKGPKNVKSEQPKRRPKETTKTKHKREESASLEEEDEESASLEQEEEDPSDEDSPDRDLDSSGLDAPLDAADDDIYDATAESFVEEVDEREIRGIAAVSKSNALATRDPLAIYMREVQGHSLLTREEETELAIRYAEAGDVDAAARLVTANLRLVVKLAYEYRRAYRNMMDLIQEGNMGLMQAVKKFDPYRGVKLSSYAAWWIRAYMLRYILANWRMVKLGTTQAQRKLFFNLNKEKARLSAMGIEPTVTEIAKQLDVTEKDVEDMDKRMARSDASLDTPVNEGDGRQIARVELMPTDETAPDLATESAELGRLLRTHLTEFRKGLSGKDLVIFDERLVADDPRTLQDLGDQFGVSRERVRQLEARMTGKLRDYLSERIGDPISLQT
jgi:RNA polymerase sigma-32 factor